MIPESIYNLVRGAEVVTDLNELITRLDLGRPLRVKYGIDPTSPHVHFGHTVPLRILKRFQDAGHQAILIIGDFTARIGDPSGRNQGRSPISAEQIAENMKTYIKQIGKFIDIHKTKVVYNSTWFHGFDVSRILQLMSLTTLQRITDRRDFAQRIKAANPVYLHELLYPLMQGYDSYKVEADIELGGTEQLYTLLLARDIQQHFEQPPQTCITVPILRGLDGNRRMGKSLNNYIGVSEDSYEIFAKTMSIPDPLLSEWYTLLTELTFNPDDHPMESKKRLANNLVEQVYGWQIAVQANHEWTKRFSQQEDPSEIPEVILDLPLDGINIIDALIQTNMAKSKTEARRLIIPNPHTDSNGCKSCVTVGADRRRITSIDDVLSPTDEIIRVGKRKIVRIRATNHT